MFAWLKKRIISYYLYKFDIEISIISGGKIDEGESLVEALQRELKEELRLELAKDELEFIGTIVGEAYPQPNMLTELNGFKVNRAIDCQKLKPIMKLRHEMVRYQ